jgi:hypothetical protein
MAFMGRMITVVMYIVKHDGYVFVLEFLRPVEAGLGDGNPCRKDGSGSRSGRTRAEVEATLDGECKIRILVSIPIKTSRSACHL